MGEHIESSGEIDILVQRDAGARGFVVGDRVNLIFRAIDPTPPYSIVVRSPTGSTIVSRVIRDLPTGAPQDPPPIDFIASAPGQYDVQIQEVKGTQRGHGTLVVR